MAPRETGTADHERRAEWLELAARAVRADRAARARRAARVPTREQEKRPETRPARLSGRMVLMDHAIGAKSLARVDASSRAVPAVRPAARVAARTATRTATETAEKTEARTERSIRLNRRGPGAAPFLALLVFGSLYGVAMAGLTAVALARFALTDPLGAVGPVAFIGVAVGFVALATMVFTAGRRR